MDILGESLDSSGNATDASQQGSENRERQILLRLLFQEVRYRQNSVQNNSVSISTLLESLDSGMYPCLRELEKEDKVERVTNESYRISRRGLVSFTHEATQ
jgi:hypothetical protein